jgi:hypothetical protein
MHRNRTYIAAEPHPCQTLLQLQWFKTLEPYVFALCRAHADEPHLGYLNLNFILENMPKLETKLEAIPIIVMAHVWIH